MFVIASGWLQGSALFQGGRNPRKDEKNQEVRTAGGLLGGPRTASESRRSTD